MVVPAAMLSKSTESLNLLMIAFRARCFASVVSASINPVGPIRVYRNRNTTQFVSFSISVVFGRDLAGGILDSGWNNQEHLAGSEGILRWEGEIGER